MTDFNAKRRIYIYTTDALSKDKDENNDKILFKIGETTETAPDEKGVLDRINQQNTTSLPGKPVLKKWFYSPNISDRDLHKALEKKYPLSRTAGSKKEWFDITLNDIIDTYHEMELKIISQIGYVQKIFDNQKNAANIIMDKVHNNSRSFLLIAEPQSGKTGAMVDFCLKLEEEYPHLFLHIFIPSDLTLKDQTKLRFCADTEREGYITSLDQKRINIHYPQSLRSAKSKDDFESSLNNDRKIVRQKNGMIVFMHDESHRDISENGIFNTRFRELNIPLTKLVKEDYELDLVSNAFNDHEISLLCTATPGPQIEFAKEYYRIYKQLPFEIVYLYPGEKYLNIQKLKDAGRIKQAIKLDKSESALSYFSSNVLNKFFEEKAGYGIVRMTSTKCMDEIKSTIENTARKYGKKVEFKIYTCNNKNISELSDDIHTPTSYHTICFILNSYLQGKTISIEKDDKQISDLSNIRFWYDTFDKSGNNDTLVAQSVGRNCGYFESTTNYPIYTDIDAVERLIKFYNTIKDINNNPAAILELPPITGTYIKRVPKQKEQNDFSNWNVVFHDSLEQRNIDPVLLNLGNHLDLENNRLMHWVSKNKENNILEDIANCRFGHYCKQIGNIKIGTIMIDKPHERYVDEWQRYIEKDNTQYLYNSQNKYITYYSVQSTNQVAITVEDTKSLYGSKTKKLNTYEDISLTDPMQKADKLLNLIASLANNQLEEIETTFNLLIDLNKEKEIDAICQKYPKVFSTKQNAQFKLNITLNNGRLLYCSDEKTFELIQDLREMRN